jgi:hypothetical protein
LYQPAPHRFPLIGAAGRFCLLDQSDVFAIVGKMHLLGWEKVSASRTLRGHSRDRHRSSGRFNFFMREHPSLIERVVIDLANEEILGTIFA